MKGGTRQRKIAKKENESPVNGAHKTSRSSGLPMAMLTALILAVAFIIFWNFPNVLWSQTGERQTHTPPSAKQDTHHRKGHIKVLGNNFVGRGLKPFAEHVFGGVTDLNVTILSHWDEIPDTKYEGAYVFLDGESWGLPDRMVPWSNQIVYVGHYHGAKGRSRLVPVPFGSLFFMEAPSIDITKMMEPRHANIDRRQRLAAYLYYRCLPHREEFFRRLQQKANENSANTAEGKTREGIQLAVDALGKCTGGTGLRKQHSGGSRFHPSYYAEAVNIYSDYLFVIAFENTKLDGYVTEKIVTAFLSGAIPIYWGSPKIMEIFNPEAFIYVSGQDDFDRAIEEIFAVANDVERQRRMRTAPLLQNGAAEKFFTWHGAVRNKLNNDYLRKTLISAAREVSDKVRT